MWKSSDLKGQQRRGHVICLVFPELIVEVTASHSSHSGVFSVNFLSTGVPDVMFATPKSVRMVKLICGRNWRKVETLSEFLIVQIARGGCEVMLKRPEFRKVAGKADGRISFTVSTRPILSPFPLCFRTTRG